MVGSVLLNFIIPVQNFGGLSLKVFRVEKHAELGMILDDFKL